MASPRGASGALFVDTNILVRFLTNDPPHLARHAERALDAAAAGRFALIVSDIVVAELAYVLTEVYALDRATARERLVSILDLPGVETTDPLVIRDASSIWSGSRLDFADAYLAALARGTENTGVLSFDRDFDRVEGVDRIDPATIHRR